MIDQLLGLYLSLNAFLHYHDNAAFRQLRREQQVLVERFPMGGAMSPPGTRYFLINCSFDLYPDPVVNLTTPAGTPMADVLFLNAAATVGWIITNADRLQVFWPMRVHGTFQRGYMDMIRYKAVPLQFPDRHEAILRAGPNSRFLRWADGDLVDITEQICSRLADSTPCTSEGMLLGFGQRGNFM